MSTTRIITPDPCSNNPNIDLLYFSRYGLTGTVKQPAENDCLGPIVSCPYVPTTTIPCTCPTTLDQNPPRLSGSDIDKSSYKYVNIVKSILKHN
jgi:hypothetical protein